MADTLFDEQQVLDVDLELANDTAAREAKIDLKIPIPACTGFAEVILDLDDLYAPVSQHVERPLRHSPHVLGMIHGH